MLCRFKIIFFLGLIFFTLTGCGQNEKSAQTTFNLSINVSSIPKAYLIITAPVGFFTLPEYYTAFSNGSSVILEYIPEGELFEKWSKIFTINFFKGKKTSAVYVTKTVEDSIASQVKRFTIIVQETTNENDIQLSKVAAQYVTNNDQVEILYMQYYSGSDDCFGVQYTEKLGSWLEFDDAEKKAKDIEKYISKYVKIKIL